jgi:ribulose-phosphate 3-epimerase
MQEYKIAASLLSADFARLGEEASAVLLAGADMLHLDVMDNHYVPNLTVGPMVCKALRAYGITAPIDVHLMVEPVDALIVEFAKAGATRISFHPEASKHVDRSLSLIQDHNCHAGLVLNPGTALHCLEPVMHKLDMIVMMSVNPGFGGQTFIPSTVEKIKQARRLIDAQSRHIHLAVDGGIYHQNIQEIARAGADTFIAGSAIFSTKDYALNISGLRQALS